MGGGGGAELGVVVVGCWLWEWCAEFFFLMSFLRDDCLLSFGVGGCWRRLK